MVLLVPTSYESRSSHVHSMGFIIDLHAYILFQFVSRGSWFSKVAVASD